MKKTTLALAALVALTSGSAFANVKKDYQLNFFAQVEDGFSFERIDGKSWSETLDLKFNPVTNQFKQEVVGTRITLASTHVQKDLSVKLANTDTYVVHTTDSTKRLPFKVDLGGKVVTTTAVLLTNDAKEQNVYDLAINIDAAQDMKIGDYKGNFALEFEYGV